MIKYFAIENFKSIKDKTVVEFDLNIENFQTDTQNWPAHPTIAFYGSNASGKTTVLQALTFVFWFMRDSFLKAESSSKIQRKPFVLNKDKSSTFHLIFELDDVEYSYFLECDDQKVIKEELYVGDNEEPTFERIENNLLQAAIQLDNVDNLRENCSVISYAAQFNSQVVAKKLQKLLLRLSGNFLMNTNERIVFNKNTWAELKSKYGQQGKLMLQLADVGIVDFGMKEGEDILPLEQLFKTANNPKKEGGDIIIPIEDFLKLLEKTASKETKEQIEATLKLSKQTHIKVQQQPTIFVLHAIENQEVELDPENQQSDGTKQFAAIILSVLEVLNEGGILILDEFETHLHQDLAAYILGLFNNPNENTKNAQLIISSHNSHFMDFLNPEQVWFAEKNKGITELYSAANVTGLEQVKERLNAYYKIGRFGAKPPALPFTQTYLPKNQSL